MRLVSSGDRTVAKDERIAARVAADLKKDLTRLAKADGRSGADYIERVLREHVAKAKNKRK